MNSSVSSGLLAVLRSDADESLRPKERHGTIDRLVEACDAISSGAARSLVAKYNPDAEGNFRRRITKIRPDRVAEYVRAMCAKDAAERRIPSKWTGPTAVTLRKDKALLAYLRAKDDEQGDEGEAPAKRSRSKLDAFIEAIPDINDRSLFRLAIARGRQAQLEANILRGVIRALRPELDPQLLIAGQKLEPEVTVPALECEGMSITAEDRAAISRLLSKLMGEDKSVALSRFNLAYDASQDRVKQLQLRTELVSPSEMAALRKLAIPSQSVDPLIGVSDG